MLTISVNQGYRFLNLISHPVILWKVLTISIISRNFLMEFWRFFLYILYQFSGWDKTEMFIECDSVLAWFLFSWLGGVSSSGWFGPENLSLWASPMKQLCGKSRKSLSENALWGKIVFPQRQDCWHIFQTNNKWKWEDLLGPGFRTGQSQVTF